MFSLEISKKKIFSENLVSSWNRLTRELVEFCSLELFNGQVDVAPGIWFGGQHGGSG